MKCDLFRQSVPAAAEASAEQLAHLRSCEQCLLVALEADSDYLFRYLGGEELIPAGGVESFADGVMQSISLRATERAVVGRPMGTPSWTRWAAAAAIVVAGSGALFYRTPSGAAVAPSSIVAAQRTFALTSQPVIESYESPDATIVELPSDSGIQVVMVFDDTLPVDL